jgi:hypothetical protein
VQAVGDLAGRGDDRVGLLRCKQSEILVHLGAGALQQAQRPDLRALQPAARDREVLHGPLRLCAPQRGDRHPDLAHGVVLDAVLGLGIAGLLLDRRGGAHVFLLLGGQGNG